jgi:hypothetical protein
MHDGTAESLFREYLERQGWQYWTEAEFRRALGLNKASPAPDFTILDDSGTPVALVEVSEFTKEIDELLPTDELTPIKTSPLPQKVRKEANQLRRVLPLVAAQYRNLPTMLVAYDPLGAQTHRKVILQRIFGLAYCVEIEPQGEEVRAQGWTLTPKGSFFRYAAQNAHISAVAALHKEKVAAHLSGFEREAAAIEAQDFRAFSDKFIEVYERYLENNVDIDEEVPVLEIYQNPAAATPWRSGLRGQFDRVWGLIDEKTYGLIYNGLLMAHAGILRGVSLPEPADSSRASGFYDE